ncbi:terminase [Chelativorans salis]|uniref:Terminase n=1 Tax=Chelativorans salis TaxID=2978478 RepID=A0ABT2LQ17_9HYPH|nr:terminase [Chelativorans sp. EGI FJ00035]MCT7375733.1 terminase [Chelativorans sp. EGI FJ00035]
MTGLASTTIDEALADPHLLGAALGDVAPWATWRVALKAAFGVTLDAGELATFKDIAGGRDVPGSRVRELWAILGRRSGKSRMAALIASYLAAFVDYSDKLSRGERGHVLVLAASKMQAQAVFQYVEGFFDASPILKQMVESVGAEEIRLKGNISISVHSNNYRSVRGRTLVACIFDEAAFWRDEASTMPDIETYRAVLPSLATTQGMLVGISSPYAQRGLLHQKFTSSFGKGDSGVLVLKAPTVVFNPTIDAQVIARAKDDDPEAAASEWDAEFRSDLSTFVERAVVERCVEAGVHERPFDRRYRYLGFCDPSGGAHDSMTLAIGHREGERVVLDCTREVKPPFAPADVCDEFSRLLKAYGVGTVTGDRFGGQWVQEAFTQRGIRYSPSERSRSEIYLDALPLLMAGTCILLDDTRLVAQVSQLERRVTRGGRDAIDHQRGGADDLANSAMGALVLAMSGSATPSWHATHHQSVADGDYDILDTEGSHRRMTGRQGIQDVSGGGNGDWRRQPATAGVDDFNPFGGV